MRPARPTPRLSAMGRLAPHAVPAATARAGAHDPMAAAVAALERVGFLDRAVTYDGDAPVCPHSSHDKVQLVSGVPPEAIERTPTPFAVPTTVLISRPGFAIHVNVARWFSGISSKKSAS